RPPEPDAIRGSCSPRCVGPHLPGLRGKWTGADAGTGRNQSPQGGNLPALTDGSTRTQTHRASRPGTCRHQGRAESAGCGAALHHGEVEYVSFFRNPDTPSQQLGEPSWPTSSPASAATAKITAVYQAAPPMRFSNPKHRPRIFRI